MPESAHDRVIEHLHMQFEAMTAGDTNKLGQLLAADFTLTHMTGYVQPKAEWLQEMNQGLFNYHDITLVDVDVAVDSATARVVARTITDATVYGHRAAWRLVLALRMELSEDDDWICVQTVASTW